jgi:hypothetical protein
MDAIENTDAITPEAWRRVYCSMVSVDTRAVVNGFLSVEVKRLGDGLGVDTLYSSVSDMDIHTGSYQRV